MIISKNPVAILPSLPLLVALLVSACDKNPADNHTKRKATEHVVEVSEAQIQPVSSRLTAIGTLEAGRKVRLYNEVSSIITYLPLHEGDAAAEHTIVIGLDDEQIEVELDKAIAQKKQAKLDYERLKKLKQQLASDEEIARARTAYDIAIADEKLARTRLHKTTIKAPLDGVITERHFEPGDVVPMYSHILTMIDPESLHVTIHISEHWIPMLQLGDKVEISIDALADSLHPGQIKRIYPTIDPDTRKGTVEVEFLPIPYGARAGQLARVKLQTHPVNRLVVPAQAVHHDAKGAYLYVVRDNKTTKTYVDKGQQYGDVIDIASGLGNGDAVVVKGFIGLRDGKDVKIHPSDIDSLAEPSSSVSPETS